MSTCPVRGQVALQVVKLSDDGGLHSFASSFVSTASNTHSVRLYLDSFLLY